MRTVFYYERIFATVIGSLAAVPPVVESVQGSDARGVVHTPLCLSDSLRLGQQSMRFELSNPTLSWRDVVQSEATGD